MKKIFALLLAVVMTLGLLAGCGTAAETPDTEAPATEAPAAEEPAAEPTAKKIDTLKVAFVPSREPQAVAALDHMGKKSAENLIAAIEKSKDAGMARLLCAFGIRQVGQKAAKVLAMHFGTLDKLMAATEDELVAIPDVGPTTAAYLRAWFANPQSQHQIRLLRAAGVSFESKEQVVDHRFAGKTFVLTGALEHFSRDEAGAIIERFGGKTSSSVSKKTSYLLAGENTGSKYQKALTLGTPIITEAEFLDMIQE